MPTITKVSKVAIGLTYMTRFIFKKWKLYWAPPIFEVGGPPIVWAPPINACKVGWAPQYLRLIAAPDGVAYGHSGTLCAATHEDKNSSGDVF